MTFTPESMKRQNELIRALQHKLAAKEQELSNEKWVFEQFLQSPSWRMTAPIRWIARQLRTIKGRISGRSPHSDAAATAAPLPAGEQISAAEARVASDLKKVFTSLYRTTFESFLMSGAVMELPAAREPEVSIILVLFNHAELTFACLRSIQETHTEKLEVLIVDNASSDETPLLLDRLRGARIIRNTENRHFLLAVNQAAMGATGQHILLLNNDAQLQPGALRAALNTLNSSADIGAVGGKIVLLDGTLQEAGSLVWRDGSCLGYGRGDTPFAPQYMFRRDVDYCSGAFLLTPRAVWQQLGGFDESFKPAYYEETDYCMRLWKHGYRVVFEPSASILHYEFASSQSIISATELQAKHQRVFAERHRTALARHEAPDPQRALYARMHHSGKKVLFMDDRPPHLWLGSGFPRANALLLALVKHNCFVTLYPLSVIDEDFTTTYTDIPKTIEIMNGAGPGMLELFLENRRNYYDILIVSRPHNMDILRPVMASHPEWFANMRIVYDAEAVFANRTAGLRKLSGDPMSTEEFEQTVRKEVELASMVDGIIAVSEQDAAAFKRHGINSVNVLGHALASTPHPNRYNERSGFLFVGAIHEETSPNGDSIIWFLTEILPLIRKELGEGISLTIAGVNKSERIRQLADSNVRITGLLEDLTPLYAEARVFVAPTRYAAGIPHKIHEAAARGLPVVATSLLAAQLGWTDQELGIGDSPEEFASRCIEVYSTPEKWSSLRAAAHKRTVSECSIETFERKVYDILAEDHVEHRSGAARFVNAGMDG